MANEDLFSDAEPAKRPQYDDLFDADPKTKAAANLRFAVPVNPDQAARDTVLAKRYGMPPAAAELFRNDFEERAKVDDGMAVLEQRPRLRSWIAEDPERAKVTHDDLDAMGLLEAGAKYLVGAKDAPRGGLLTDVARAARSVASGAPSLSAGLYGGVAAVAGLTDQFVQALDDAAAWVTGTPRRQIMGTPGPESFFRDQQRNANTVAADWMGLDPAAGDTERAVMSGFQSAGSNLLTLPAGFVRNGTNIMLGLMGTSVGGQSYGKGRDAGLDPLRATGYAVQDATAEIVMERYFGAAGLLKNIKAGASAGKLFAYEVFREVPGEVATTIWQNFNEWANLHPDKSLADFIEEQPAAIRDTIIATLVGGTTQIGAVKGVQRVLGGAAKEEEKARQSDAMARALDNLQKTAEASKLLERSPENLRSYMQSLVEDDVPEVYVDSARLQEAGLDLTQLAQALPSVAEQLTEVATGGDLVIPTSELLVNSIGTEFAQALIDNARVREDAMSRAEAQAWIEAKGEEIRSSVERTLAEQEQNAEWRKNRDELQQQILAQLNALGRFDAKVNERNALLAAQHYAVTAAQLGMTPQQLAQQYRLEWTGQEQEQTYNQQQGQDGAVTGPDVGNVSPSGPGGARIFNQGPNDGRDRRDSGDGAGRSPAEQNLSTTVAGKPAAEGWPGATRIRRGPGLGPLTVYRGAAESLKPEHFGLSALGKASGNPSSGLGVWFTTGQDEAGRYGKVEPMQLDLRNPKILRFDELPGFDSVEEAHAWREQLRKQGHDGLFLHGKGLGKKEAHIVIFEPTQAVYPDDARFSRGQGNGIPMADAKAAVALIRKALPKAPAIHLYESLDKAPSAVVEAIEQQGARDDVEAVYHGGEIHAFPGNLESVERLMFVVGRHEVRHHGLRALLGPDLNSLMLTLYENEAVKQAADEKMAAGVSSRVLAVEEALADMPVEQVAGLSGFDKVMATIRQWLRKFADGLRTRGFASFADAIEPDKWTDNDVAALVSKAEDVSRYGRAGYSAGGTAFSREYQQDARGSVAFGEDITKTPSIISVLEKADLSTIAHELGHFFWEMRFDLAVRMEARARAGETLTDGERQILDDTYRALDWLDVRGTPELTAIEQWLTMSVDEKRPYHEKMARAHEAYLFEGKAPSLELQGLFQTFRSWLLNVCRALLKTMSAGPGDIGKALNVELTDEFRQVMDRMLATAEQIAEAEAARNMGPLFQTAEEAGMTPAEYEAYQRLGIRASLDAQDELQAKSLKDLQWLQNARSRVLKELQRQHDALRRDVRAQVRVEVMAQPVYQAWAFLTKRQFDKVEGDDAAGNARGLNPEVDNLFTAIAKLGGLDREAVQKAWGIDPKEKIESGVFGMPVLRKDGGLGLDAMAERLMEAGYLLPDEQGKADLAKFEEVFDDQRRGTDRFSIQRDLAAAYGEPEVVIPDVPDTGYGRLRTEDLRRMYGMGDNAIWRVLSKRRMTSDDGGLSPEVVAAMFTDENGDPVFDSGDALVRALATAEPPRDVIERLTDARMLQDHAEVAAPGALERAADIAVHNEARAKFVATELGALQKAVTVREKVPGQRNTVDVLAQAAKDYAKGIIYRKRVRDLRPAQYAAAEARAAKAAAKAKGDMVKAAEHKRNQLVNLHATKAAYQAQTEIEAALQYFRRVAKPGSVPATHHDQIMALLDKFDLSDTPLKALDNRARFRTWAKAQLDAGLIPPNVDMLLTPEQRAQFGAEVARRNEDGELIYPNEEDQALLLAGYIDEMPVRNYRDATVEEILGLRDAVRQIEHIGRRTKKVLTDRKNREFEAVVTSMRQRIEDVAEKMGRKAGDIRSSNTAMGRLKEAWGGYFFDHIKVANLARIMDGEEGGPVWEHLVRTANEAGVQEAIDLASAHDAIQKLLKPVKDLGGITDKAIHFPSIGRSLNRQARLVMALNLGNESNTQRLLGGEGWTMEQIKPVLDTLTAADWQFVQGMWDHYESYRPRVAEMERLINGVEPEWIKARPITVQTADGQTLTLRGGYAPVIYDPRASGKAASQAAEKDAKAMMQAARVASTVNKSFTKARVEEVKGRPLLLSLNAMIGGVEDTIHYLNWQPAIIDTNRLIKALDPTIREYYGAEVVTQLRAWVEQNAAGLAPVRKASESIAANLSRNVSFAAMAFNVWSAVQQITGYSQSVVVVGAPWLARGVARSIANPRQAYLQAVEKSDFLKKRASTRMRDIAEIENTIQDRGLWAKNRDRLGYAMMLTMQAAVDVPTWWGAYERAIDGGKDEQTAVALADQAVIDAQGSGMQKDLANVERSNGLMRIMTGFMSYMNTTMNLNYRVLKSDQNVAQKAVDLMLLNVIPVVLTMLLKSLTNIGGDDEEDPEKTAKKYLANQASFLLGQMVYIRELSQIGSAFMGEYGGNYSGPSGTRLIADTAKLAQQIGQGEMDDGLRKALINVLGVTLRLPSAQANKTITGTQAVIDGETEGVAQTVAAPVFGFQRQ
jgi:hypothetical protein